MKQKLTIFMLFQLMLGMAQVPHLVIPKGHTDGISSACFSNDGRHLITGCRDKTAKVWNLAARELQTFKLMNQVQAVAFSPGGDSVLTGSTDGLISLFKITGELIRTFRGHMSYISSVAFSPDGQFILSGSRDNTAKLWDMDGYVKQTFTHKNSVTSVAFSNDGKFILTGCEDKTAILWSANGGMLHTFTGHLAKILQVKFSHDGNSILTASEDHSAILWNIKGIKLHQYKHTDKVNACDISLDGQMIAIGGNDGIVKIWKVAGNLPVKSFKAFDWAISSVIFSPDGKSIVITSEASDDAKQFDLSGKQIQSYSGQAHVISSVGFATNGNAILAGCSDHTAKLWDLANGNFKTLVGHNDKVNAVSFSRGGDSIITASDDKSVKLWNKKGKEIQSFELSGMVKSVVFSPDGKYILTAGFDGSTQLLDSNGYKRKLSIPSDIINAAVFSPDGNSVAMGSDKGIVSIMDLSGSMIKNIEVSSQINSLTYTLDGKSIITGNFNGLAQMWDIQSGDLIKTFGAPGEEILSISLSKDGKLLATGSSDGKAKLWDFFSSDPKILEGHATKILSVNFSSDNKKLITSSADGTIKLWDCQTAKGILTIVPLDLEDWVVTNPDGLFDASPGAMRLMYYQVGMELVELDQLKEKYYEPGLLGSTLGFTKTDRKEISTLTTVALYPEIDASIVNQDLVINLKERSGGLGKLSLLINNKEVLEDANVDRKNSLTIHLDSFQKYFLGDTNIISLRVYNTNGWLKSQSYDLPYSTYKSKGDEGNTNQNQPEVFKGLPNLYAIVVGTSKYKGDKLNLKFPDLDAKAIANAIQSVGSALFTNRLEIKLLTTDAKSPEMISSRKNIETAFMDVAGKAKAGDVLLAYFSGHGSTYGEAENSQFYYLTKDFASDDLSNDSDRNNFTVSSNDLTKWLTSIAARKQVMIFDACHSGKVVESLIGLSARDLTPSQIRALDRMKDRTGMFILAGSAADKVSFEANQFGQGLLTYSLLEGISGLALMEDRVDVAKLFQYSRDRVPELAKGINKIQIPVTAFPQGGGSFDIGIKNASVNISLALPKPVFIRNTFISLTTKHDDLGIATALNDYLNNITARGTDSDFVFADVNEFDNGYSITGFYSVKGNDINLDGTLLKGKTSLGDFQVSGNTNSLPAFVEAIVGKASPLIK